MTLAHNGIPFDFGEEESFARWESQSEKDDYFFDPVFTLPGHPKTAEHVTMRSHWCKLIYIH